MFLTGLDGRGHDDDSCEVAGVSVIDGRRDRGVSGTLFSVEEGGCVGMSPRAEIDG